VPYPKLVSFTAWSFSRWSQYTKCPLSARLKFLEKVPEPPPGPDSPLARGDRIHKLATAYIKGEIPARMPAELNLFPRFFKRMRQIYKKHPELIVTEEDWVFRKDWSRTVWNDWNGAWLRVKLDCAFVDGTVVAIVDHKTGKYAPNFNLQEYILQLELYALAALLVYGPIMPTVRVIPALHFLDQEVVYPEPGSADVRVYTLQDLPALKKLWLGRVAPMLADKTFTAKPGSHCKWCFYRKANKEQGGGQCIH
jgi:RecB family exonuclease